MILSNIATKREIEIYHRANGTKEYHWRCFNATNDCIAEGFINNPDDVTQMVKQGYETIDVWEADETNKQTYPY